MDPLEVINKGIIWPRCITQEVSKLLQCNACERRCWLNRSHRFASTLNNETLPPVAHAVKHIG